MTCPGSCGVVKVFRHSRVIFPPKKKSPDNNQTITEKRNPQKKNKTQQKTPTPTKHPKKQNTKKKQPNKTKLKKTQ